MQQPRGGEEGSPEGDSGTKQEDSQDRGAATGGKLQRPKEGESEGGDIEGARRELQGPEGADKGGSEGEDSGGDYSDKPGAAGRDEGDEEGLHVPKFNKK